MKLETPQRKTAVFIPVRLSSTRLPSKALLDLCGKPCILRLIDRVKRAKKSDLIVICTTKEKIDQALVKFASMNGIKCFQGSTKDILDRYLNAAIKFDVSYIVNVDGDDVFCDPEYIDQTIDELKKDDTDCVVWDDMPFGSIPLGIRLDALKKICEIKDTSNTETGWGRFFTETNLFKVQHITDKKCKKDKSIRLTLDYPEDFKLFEKIYENLKEPFSIVDIVNFLQKNPELKKINCGLEKEYNKNFEVESTKIKLKKSKIF